MPFDNNDPRKQFQNSFRQATGMEQGNDPGFWDKLKTNVFGQAPEQPQQPQAQDQAVPFDEFQKQQQQQAAMQALMRLKQGR